MNEHTQRTALALARHAVAEGAGLPVGAPPALGPEFDEPAALFVTIRLGERLVGCIGTTEAVRPLGEAIRRFAALAAFDDPRTPRLTAEMLPNVRFEISILSPLERVDAASTGDAIASLRPDEGYAIEQGPKRGVLLPQVWGALPEPGRFWAALLDKAQIAGDAPWPTLTLSRFAVTHMHEPGYRAPEAE